ncbi:hypothetical protein [Streptomyces puniciscabiei]|uniref:hypothetical protein n=1 Tax=Streptomyces puniciscabiei TaxID=164348 RepID=UPI0037A98956
MPPTGGRSPSPSPWRRLHFRQAPPGSTFCLRDTTRGDIAVVTVIDVDHGNYATTDDVTYYRRRS